MIRNIAIGFLILFATIVFCVLSGAGCASLAKNTKEKAINTGGRVYGIRVDSAAGTAGNLAPSVVFGSAEWNYLSVPADTKNARITVDSAEAGWFTSAIQARRRVTIELSESPFAEDLTEPENPDETARNPTAEPKPAPAP